MQRESCFGGSFGKCPEATKRCGLLSVAKLQLHHIRNALLRTAHNEIQPAEVFFRGKLLEALYGQQALGPEGKGQAERLDHAYCREDRCKG